MDHTIDALRYLWLTGNSLIGSQLTWNILELQNLLKLTTSGQPLQFSAPRQHGKSLWISTTSPYFQTFTLFSSDHLAYENLLQQESGCDWLKLPALRSSATKLLARHSSRIWPSVLSRG